jgi:hypothetical protein
MRPNRMMKRLAAGLLFGMALANVAWPQGATMFDGQYLGKLTLTKVVSGDCTRPPPGALYPLRISGGQVEFKYVPRFDTILQGKVDANGSFQASQRVRYGLVSMVGRIRGNNVTASITSPSCRYSFTTQY